MKRNLIITLFLIILGVSAKGALTADWRLHLPFDIANSSVFDTPKRVYFVSPTFNRQNEIPGRDYDSYSLFYYDKNGNEILPVNQVNGASGNSVTSLSYNPDKGYLLVVYTDFNIDFIYDDGRIYNVQALKTASIPGRKRANQIFFDPKKNEAYIATGFGYIVLNDNKYEVSESRNYGENIQSIVKCKDDFIILSEGEIYKAPIADPRYNFSDYRKISNHFPAINVILPKDDGSFYGLKTGSSAFIYNISPDEDDPDNNPYTWVENANDPNIFNYAYTTDGYAITGNVRCFNYKKNGNEAALNRPRDAWANAAIYTDNVNLWVVKSMEGLRHFKRENNDWTLLADYMRPNAPATSISTSMAYHPKFGLLAGSNGVDVALNAFNQNTRAQLSALQNNFWKEYSPLYTLPDQITVLPNFSGVSIDPQDNKYVYRVGKLQGLIRINLEDPSALLAMGSQRSSLRNYSGFVEVASLQNSWDQLCNFTLPTFDANGTMWTCYEDRDNKQMRLYYWSAEDRKASVSPATYRPMKYFPVKGLVPYTNSVVLALKHSNNRNLIVFTSSENLGEIHILDHKGTPDATNDDKYVVISNPSDQDGGRVLLGTINSIVEDPETGLLWIMSGSGLYTLNPKTAFENPKVLNRIKVARNDGTNLADYLLNEVNVYDMCIDGEGRKWFGTFNGVVGTSADGKTILAEFTPENSYLPSLEVYSAAYNAANNSVMFGTEGGLVEMFPSGSGNSVSAEGGVRIYPNPVEPDFYGWVRMDNIADGSLVKITDSRGGIIKELGPVESGAVEWDITGMDNRRVATGVYYVMVSPGANGGETSINKILVLN